MAEATEEEYAEAEVEYELAAFWALDRQALT